MAKLTRCISSTRIGSSVLKMDVKVSKEISRLADGLIKRTSSVLDEIDSKAVHEEEKGDQLEEKEVIF